MYINLRRNATTVSNTGLVSPAATVCLSVTKPERFAPRLRRRRRHRHRVVCGPAAGSNIDYSALSGVDIIFHGPRALT